MFTLLGSLFGGLLRFAPELLAFFDKKNDRAHEAAMFDKQVALDVSRAKAASDASAQDSRQRIDEAQATGAISLDAAGLAALTESIKGQSQLTGSKWIDGPNQLMRPFLTFWWCIILETAAMVATYVVLTTAGKSPAEALIQMWGPEEKAIVAGMINFWFLDRVIRYRQGSITPGQK